MSGLTVWRYETPEKHMIGPSVIGPSVIGPNLKKALDTDIEEFKVTIYANQKPSDNVGPMMKKYGMNRFGERIFSSTLSRKIVQEVAAIPWIGWIETV